MSDSTLTAWALGLAAGSLLALSGVAAAHGDVTPQSVNTKELPALNGEVLYENPYRGDPDIHAKAAEVGASAYNQNCARCHGLGAVSGGIAPDLRLLPPDGETDEYFHMRVNNGVVRNGVTYMPPFAETFSEEAIWAIKSFLDTVHVEDL